MPYERRTNIKHGGLWTAIGIGLGILVGLLTVQHGYAAEKEHEPTCTLETVKGRYLFANSGMLLPPHSESQSRRQRRMLLDFISSMETARRQTS